MTSKGKKATATGKAPATGKTAKATATGKTTPQGDKQPPALRDVFGFGMDTKVHQFGDMLLAEGGCTMKEVKEATGQTHYNVFAKLVAKGLAEKQPDGRMVATAQAREAPGVAGQAGASDAQG